MKKTKGKGSKPKQSVKLAPGEKLELNELIAGIDNDLKTVHDTNLDDNFDFEDGEDKTDIGRHICIELANKEFAIPLSSVLEAGENIAVQPLPLLPDWLTGITNIRGEIISVVDLNLFFGIKDSTQITKHMPVDVKSYLIIHNDEMKLAILIDKILATRPLYSSVKQKFTNTKKKDMLSKHFSGQAFYERDNVQKGIFLFDLDKFLSSGNLHDFSIA